MPTARFFFDAGSGTLLWAAPEDQAEWDYPPDPGPWSDEDDRRFNADVRRLLARLRAELGPAWVILDEFIELPKG